MKRLFVRVKRFDLLTNLLLLFGIFLLLGSVILMHKDSNVLKNDIQRIRDMEKNNELFTFERQAGVLKSPSTIGLDELGG